MKKTRLTLMLLTLLVAAVSISAVSSIDANQVVDGLNSTDNLTQALADADESNKNLLIIFDQASCYYCDLLKSDVLSDKEVQKELNENYVVLIVDINKEPELAGELQVMGTPTVSIIDKDYNEIGRIDGYVPVDEFLQEI